MDEKEIMKNNLKTHKKLIKKVLMEDKVLTGLNALGELIYGNDVLNIPCNSHCGIYEIETDKDEKKYYAQISYNIRLYNILNEKWDNLNENMIILENCKIEPIEEKDIPNAIMKGNFVFYDNKNYEKFFKINYHA